MNIKFNESELEQMQKKKDSTIPTKHALSRQATIEQAINNRTPMAQLQQTQKIQQTQQPQNINPPQNMAQSNGYGRNI